MKKKYVIMIIAFIILFGIVIFIIIKNNQKYKPYNDLEAELESQAIALIGATPSLAGTTNVLTLKDFESYGYTINAKVNNDTCDGYVKIENQMYFYKYSAYIKCNNYTTKGYQKQ